MATKNFKSGAAYKNWLGYIHANDLDKKGGADVTIKGKKHKVDRSAAKQTKDMKTNQDGGRDSSTEAADQLKELGSPTKQGSPAQESSWQHEDNIRAEWFRKHGDEAHAEALDKDADSAGYGRDWTGIAEQKSFAKQFNAKSPMARLKSPAYKHGAMKGDQSATHTDYANYKGTDKGYHGHTGSSHGDQSATHRDYMHTILKHMKR